MSLKEKQLTPRSNRGQTFPLVRHFVSLRTLHRVSRATKLSMHPGISNEKLGRGGGGVGRPGPVSAWIRSMVSAREVELSKNFKNTERLRNRGRNPFKQNFRKFRSKTQWIGSVQPETFPKNWSTFWGGPRCLPFDRKFRKFRMEGKW